MEVAGLTLSIIGASMVVAEVRNGFQKVLELIANWHSYPKDVEKFKGGIAAAHQAFERWNQSIKFVYQNRGDTRDTDEDRAIAASAESILMKVSEELSKATKILEQHITDQPTSPTDHRHDLEAGTATSPVIHPGTYAPSATGTRKTWILSHRGQLERIADAITKQMHDLTKLSPEAYAYSLEFLGPKNPSPHTSETEEAGEDGRPGEGRQPGGLSETPATPADPAPNDALRRCFGGDTYEDIKEGERSTSNYGTFVDGDYRGSLQLGSGSSFKGVETGKESISNFGTTFGGKSPFQMALEARRQESSSSE